MTDTNTHSEKNPEEEAAASKIQKCFRKFVLDKGGLSIPSYKKFRDLIEQIESMDRAEGGKTKVYLPKDTEIVLKECGREAAIKRFLQMQQVRSLLGHQNSSHLTVPDSAVVDHFMVETRLPILADRFYNMGLYVKHPHLFNEAIRELTRMFSKIALTDLVSPQNHPCTNIVGDVVRWDNLPLYIEEINGVRVGKIGFVDLEHITNRIKSEYSDYTHFEELPRIFPYHLSLILEEIHKIGFPVNQEKMAKEASKGKAYLDGAYITHSRWIEETNTETKPGDFNISPEQKEQIIERIEKEIALIAEGTLQILDKKYKYGESWTPPTSFKETVYQNKRAIAEKLTQLLLKGLSTEVEKEVLNLSKYTQLSQISLRSVALSRRDIYEEASYFLLKEYPSLKRYHDEIADQLLFSFFEELVKQKNLFSFDHGFNTGGHAFCWIRF